MVHGSMLGETWKGEKRLFPITDKGLLSENEFYFWKLSAEL